MKQYVISERQFISYILDGFRDSLTEARINPETESWYVFRLGTEDGINGYTITSSRYPDNVLGPIISAAKTRWKKEGDLPANPSPDAYLYQYLVDRIVNTVREKPDVLQSKTAFSSAIRKFVPEIEQLNDQMLNKETAERMKREFYQEDKNSFKHKGAAVFKQGGIGRPTGLGSSVKSAGRNTKDILRELFNYDEIFYNGKYWVFNKYAFDEMMMTELPPKIKAQIRDIYKDPKSKGTFVKDTFIVLNNPVISNLFKNYKKIFDEEVFTNED